MVPGSAGAPERVDVEEEESWDDGSPPPHYGSQPGDSGSILPNSTRTGRPDETEARPEAKLCPLRRACHQYLCPAGKPWGAAEVGPPTGRRDLRCGTSPRSEPPALECIFSRNVLWEISNKIEWLRLPYSVSDLSQAPLLVKQPTHAQIAL